LTILATGNVSETELVIDRGRWELVAGSIAVFLAFVALIPVRLRRDWRTHGVYGAFVAQEPARNAMAANSLSLDEQKQNWKGWS
jgi:hypothetical protein